MWNDEDNNPYASERPEDTEDIIHREASSFAPHDDSYDDGSTRATHAGTAGDNSSLPDDDDHDELEDIEVDEYGRAVGGFERTAGYGFQNRIQQILEEDPDLPILIVDAGKNVESGGSYIVYTIRTGDLEVRRRYSEFSSLRDVLVQLHPTLIIPPIPSKHSMADYAAKPTRAKEDLNIIDLRKRMLQVFLNRCRSMPQIRDDGVWWRFLDPNANWNEVLHSPPASLLPKNLLKAPPVNPWNPLPAHAWLPVPSANARLKGSGGAAAAAASSTSVGGVPHFTGPGAVSTAANANIAASMNSQPQPHPSSAAAAADMPPGTVTFQSPITGEFLPRFPPPGRRLSESELDPYFNNYEHSTKELENLLNGNIEKVNRRTLAHLSTLSTDMMELGARLNAFSLSESSRSLASAIEQTGQAFDRSYILTSELNGNLSATFAEPMRELAQFASVVRSVVRYRVLKRVQQEMTREELEKKRVILDSLERSEMEASRINQYLTTRGVGGEPHAPGTQHQRGLSTPEFANPSASPQRPSPSTRTIPERGDYRPTSSSSSAAGRPQGDDASSIDSDFPPQHDNASTPSWSTNPSAGYAGSGMTSLPPPSPTPPQPQQLSHRKSSSMTGKLFGRISHAVHGFVDVDPEKTRRDQMGKTKEGLTQLEQALKVSEKDVKLASEGVLADLKRFQEDQEDDLRRYMVAYARCHLDWARKNLETWTEAKEEALKIDRQKFLHRDGSGHPVSGGNHGHRRHRLHSRHHHQAQQDDQVKEKELREDKRRSHPSRPTSPPPVQREKEAEKTKLKERGREREKERERRKPDEESTTSTGSKARKSRERGDRDRDRYRERILREGSKKLQRKSSRPEADSAQFLTPAALRRGRRQEAKKKALKAALLHKNRRNEKREGGRDDEPSKRERKDKERSKSIFKSRSPREHCHHTTHSARSSPQPEASPSSSSLVVAAESVSTRKATATSSPVAHRDSKRKDRHSAVKPSSSSSSTRNDRKEKEIERNRAGKSGSPIITSPTTAVADSSRTSPD
ncbi:mediator complex subunit, partial [Ascosphaera pollenicola]